MSEPIRRGQFEMLIDGESITAPDPTSFGPTSLTFETSPVQLNARTYRLLTGQRMPGSVQTTFKYEGAAGRREKRIRKHHWQVLNRLVKGMAVSAEEMNRALESLGLAMTSVQDAMKENQ